MFSIRGIWVFTSCVTLKKLLYRVGSRIPYPCVRGMKIPQRVVAGSRGITLKELSVSDTRGLDYIERYLQNISPLTKQ